MPCRQTLAALLKHKVPLNNTFMDRVAVPIVMSARKTAQPLRANALSGGLTALLSLGME